MRHWAARFLAAAFLILGLAAVLPAGAQVATSFSPNGSATLSVSGSSSRVAFPTSGPTALIINVGSNAAYLKFGSSAVVATTSGYLLNPGCSVAYDISGQGYVAGITASSTTSLSVLTGAGIPTLPPSGCTSAGGSSSTTITAPLGNQSPATSVSVTGPVGSAIAPAVVALSTTAAQVLATGTTFSSRVVCNDDASIVEYFGPASVTNTGANGVKVSPGQCWDFSHNTAAIFGVSASATPNARVVQY